MSKIKQQNPSIDFGFYATVPRVVRTNYRDKVTPIMKWLYTCLKDLCGDDGTCYRTLRVLSEETGISTGLLSESIPILHEVGLIHAEKKKRSTGGKEVWHITIVDIWIANGKAHPTKRSHYEQTQASENVHDTNVHNVNETTGECSCGERECSQILDRRKNTLSKNNTEERTNNSVSDDNTSSSQENTFLQEQLAKRDEQIALLLEQVTQLSTRIEELSTSFTQADKPTTGEANKQVPIADVTTQNTPPSEPAQSASNKGNGKRTKKDATQDLTLQGSHIIEIYEAFKKRKTTRNPGNVKAANGLGDVVESDQDLNEVLTLMANDNFLKEHGVRIDLDFVYRKYDGFLDRVDKLREEAKRRALGKRTGNAPIASTPGSQYIVNELDEVADSYIAAVEMKEELMLVGIGD